MNDFSSPWTHTLRNWNVRILATAVALGTAMWFPDAFAQSGAGSIQGTIQDSTGAVIPGTSIHVVQQGTNTEFDTKCNGVGFYIVPDLFTGTYVITYSASGFKTAKVTVELQVAQSAVINPILTAGAVTQQVVVAADVIQLTTTDNGTISSVLENNRISQLPMNGRSVLSLASMTTPGLEDSGQRVNGLMPEALEYVQDGASLANRQFGGEQGPNGLSQAQLPDADAVQEVRIDTTNTSAQYAEPATAIITTKSGTNSLHGALFETALNNYWGVARDRQDPTNFRAPKMIRNEFGASAGGPVILPHVYHGKDKSFWFFAYERYSLAAASVTLTTVLTQAMRGGDWSGLINSSGVLQKLYDPSTTQSSTNCNGTGSANAYCRAPFPTVNGLANQIPIGRISPTAKILYAIKPLPTTTDNPLIANNLALHDPSVTILPTTTFRFDHSFNENNRVFLRYTDNIDTITGLSSPTIPATLAGDGLPANATGLGYFPLATFTGALGYTHVFSPTFFVETNVSQQWLSQLNTSGGGALTTDYEAMLGMPNNFGENGFPGIGGSSTIMPTNTAGFGGYGINQIISNIDENLTKTSGRHQMQFGGRYRHERLGYLPDSGSDAAVFGAYATALENPGSGTNYTATANTGYLDAVLFLGAAASYTVYFQPAYQHYKDMEFDAYFQDNFHVSKRFTANLGLRYEAHPAVYTKDGLLESFNINQKAAVFTNAVSGTNPLSYYVNKGYTIPGIVTNLLNLGMVMENSQQAGYPSTNLRNDDFTIGPRVGLAYLPFKGKYGTVVRGAYGRYIYPMPVRSYLKLTVSGPPFRVPYAESYIAANQSPDGLPNYLLRSAQTVITGVNSANVVNTNAVNGILPGVNLDTIDPDFPPDFVTQTNFTIEQPIKGSSAVRLSWLYVHGTNLDQVYFYNKQPSTYVWEVEKGIVPPTGTYASTATGPYDQTLYGSSMENIQKSGWSNDNALQVNYQRLYHRGIAYQVSYVWSKPFRVGGNSSRDGTIDPYQDYLPGFVPAQPTNIAPWAYTHQLDRFQNYLVDTAIPKQHITFNGIVDVPVGRGKRFLDNANRFVNELVGGFQLASDGNIVSQDFALQATTSTGGVANTAVTPVTNWGPTSPLKVYKHNAPITDCRSGVCHAAFLWYNGYLSPTVQGASNGVTGLPSGYVPFQTPINNTPGTSNYGNNNVPVTLSNGSVVQVAYSPGPQGANPFSHTVLNGPINWTIDLSLFKVFPIKENMNLRFNMDAFNALNVQGYNIPNINDGTESLLSSANSPRVVQFTLRLTF